MNKKTFGVLIALLTFIVGVGIAKLSLPQLRKVAPNERDLQLSNYKLSGPYQYENLSIFLVHGTDQPNSILFTPLQEAMERKVVIVHETSDVNELAIENVSKTEEVFVQAGDIVKGGNKIGS
jgi:ARG and Rhodanese-Phosphatase-superfamily-associated Protein domain